MDFLVIDCQPVELPVFTNANFIYWKLYSSKDANM